MLNLMVLEELEQNRQGSFAVFTLK